MTVWLNIDKKHRTGTIHVGECDDVTNRDNPKHTRKGTVPSVRKLNSYGGWVAFESRRDALAGLEEYREIRRNDPKVREKEVGQLDCPKC